MSLRRKKCNQKEKEEILLYVEEHGISRVFREHSVSTATIYNWKRKYEELGIDRLCPTYKITTKIPIKKNIYTLAIFNISLYIYKYKTLKWFCF